MTTFLITRRDLMLGAVGVAVSGACRDTAPAGVVSARVSPATPARVVVARDAHALGTGRDVNRPALAELLDRAMMALTGEASVRPAWLALFSPRDVVGLVDTQSVLPTHPELLDLVQQRLWQIGIPPFRIRRAQGGRWRAEGCTALINIPGLKAHWLTGIGTVLKNYITYADTPSAYHGGDSANLGEIWRLPGVEGKTRLVIVDALRPLCDKGPQPDPRFMWDYRGLVAGTDPVAVERVGLEIILARRRAIRGADWPLSPPPLCVEAADLRFHLGTSRLDRIAIERVGWQEDILI